MKRLLNGPYYLGICILFTAQFMMSCQTGPSQVDSELIPLQGYWEGKGAGGKCTITINGNSLHYQADSGWYKTTFTLTPNTNPQQMKALIIDCGPSKDPVGIEVFVVFKIEGETLTLTTYDESYDPPEKFDGQNVYVVMKADLP